MALSKERLGRFIERVDKRNTKLIYGIDNVRGISNMKEIQPTKADVSERSFERFQIVEANNFVFNRRTTRMGEKLGLGYNNIGETFIVTEDYVVFRVKNADKLLPDYLNVFFRCPEFDRYARWDSWGSATEFFNWEEMCDVPIIVPSLSVQQKYVDVYKAMLANQRAYESGLEDLTLTINAQIEQFKHTAKRVPMGELIEEIDVRNNNNEISDVQGINISKQFMPSVANLSTTDLSKYKVINKGQFAYSAMQTGRDECIRIALYYKDNPCVISPAYSVLKTKSNADVLAEYIMLWFSRSESDRYGWFISDSSIRASLELSRFYEIEIPLPSLKEQKALVNFYNARQLTQNNVTKLSETIKEICPILIKGSVEEARA
jgi:type I restriction enzyme S subunit